MISVQRSTTALALAACLACSPGDSGGPGESRVVPVLASLDESRAAARVPAPAESAPLRSSVTVEPGTVEPGTGEPGTGEPGDRPPDRPAGPALRAASPNFQFGSVFEGALVRHTFELQSSGTADLVVSKIKPGCGCTAADPIAVGEDGARRAYEVGTPLPPGARLELDVTFDTYAKAGSHAKSINVYCNDPRGVERLSLIGRVEPFLNVVPNNLQLGRLTVGASRTGEVTLTTRDGGPVKLSANPALRPAALSVVLTPKNPDGQGRSSAWLAAVTLGGESLREGPFQFHVAVQSDVANPNAPEDEDGNPVSWTDARAWLGGTVSVSAEVLGLYAVSPREMFFGPVAPDTTVSRTVRIQSYAEVPPVEHPRVRLVGHDAEPLVLDERYHLTVARLEEAAGWTVELLLDGLPAGHGLFGGKLVLETENPDQPEITIPFKGVVR